MFVLTFPHSRTDSAQILRNKHHVRLSYRNNLSRNGDNAPNKYSCEAPHGTRRSGGLQVPMEQPTTSQKA